MTPFRVLLFGLFALAALLWALNPGPERFQEFLREEVARRTAEAAGAAGEAAGGSMGRDVAGFIADRLGNAARDAAGVAADAFERDDYVVASVYRVDLNGRQPGGEIEFLGIANQFFPLKMPAVLQDL